MTEKPLPHSTSTLLSQICRLMRTRKHALWDEIGLYQGQPFVLQTLWQEEGITHSDLANRMHVRPATISNMIKRMEKSGFVERRLDLDDERVSRVFLTEDGRRIQDQVEKVWSDLDTTIFAGFSPEECTLLQRSLERVRDNLLRLRGSEIR